MELDGAVTTGREEGAYYIGMDEYQEKFHAALGFYPFPGTLNLRVDPEERERFMDGIPPTHIDAPVRDGKRLSDVAVYPVKIGGVDGALLDLEKTDHPDAIAEIIAPINLREELGLEDGDNVAVRPRT